MDTTTTNLDDFGRGGRAELIDLLNAWHKQGLPRDFHTEEVHPMMNIESGYVFLTNWDYQVAMMNGDKLERWYNCSNCGHEGFLEDCQLNDEGCNECSPSEEEREIE